MNLSEAANKVKGKVDKVFYKGNVLQGILIAIGNPFLTGLFTNDSSFIACGYDKVPFVFKKNSSSDWTFSKILDEGFN